MNTIRLCQQCRQPLPENAPEGLCPACLAKVALGSEPAASGATINVNPLAEAAPDTRVPPSVTELAPQFPQLEILELLGMGGMGMVYKARQPRLDRFVALKILPVDSATHPSFAERFNREAKALAKLNHPGIVAVYDFGQTGQYYYFIMEYVDGMNLRQLLQAKTLDPRQALELVTQICTALQFAHDEGVVHRDIKPENILLNKKGQVKIADFGLAKLLGAAPDTALTMSQAAMGTFNYMAPEQRENAQKVDHRADIYSLGVVFYEMLTGEVPMGRFEPPSKKVQIDVRLDEVVLHALEREPARRYQHVSEVKSGVETITSTPPQAPAAPPAASAAQRISESLLNRDHQLQIRYCLRRGWGLVKSDFWPTVGVTVLILTLLEIATITLDQLGEAAKGTSLGFAVIQCLLTGPMLAGLTFYFLKKIRRERATVEIAFVGFSKRFLHLFLANFVLTVLVAFGIFFLILPGIYLFVAWAFALTLVIDKGLDFWPAMELSRKIIHKHWWKMLIFLFVLGALWIVGLLCFVVGIFVAVPVTFAAFMYAYEDIFGYWTSANRIADQSKLAGEAKGNMEAINSTIPAAQPTTGAPANLAPKQLSASNTTWIVYFVVEMVLTLGLGAFLIQIVPAVGFVWIVAVFLVASYQLNSRKEINDARESGLWPQPGELPTLEHVKLLARAGKRRLAIKLYRQIHGVSGADAKAAVEKLAGHSTPPHEAGAPPPATQPPATAVSLEPRLSKAALAGAAWAFGFFPFAVGSLLIVGTATDFYGRRPQSAIQMLQLLFEQWGTDIPPGTPLWQAVLLITILSVGLTAPFGATILGYVALSHIRHSAGRLYGLGLALFDVLLFPLVIADCLIFLLLVSIWSPLGRLLAGPMPPNSALSPIPLFLLTGLISVVLDYFIVRKVWRSIHRKSEI